MRRWYHVFIDDRHVDTVLSGWSPARMIRYLQRKHPDAKTYEVRYAQTDTSTFLLKGS